MKLNELKEEYNLNEIALKDTRMSIEVMRGAIKVLLICVSLIPRTRLLLNITSMINLAQVLILGAFSKILKMLCHGVRKTKFNFMYIYICIYNVI